MTENLMRAYESGGNRWPEFKSLSQLAHDLGVHAENYLLDDGKLVADLRAAANYLNAFAKRDLDV